MREPDEHEFDELDRLMDAALSSYADPGVAGDLDERILRYVTASARQRRRARWLAWAIVLPAAACALIAVAVLFRKPEPAPGNSEIARHRQVPEVRQQSDHSPQLKTTHLGAVRFHSRPPISKAAPEELPRLAVFPTPQPLTPQELALTVYASQLHSPEPKPLAATTERPDTPISIAAIQIPLIQPLEPPSEGAN
jgi:hypothetical protein